MNRSALLVLTCFLLLGPMMLVAQSKSKPNVRLDHAAMRVADLDRSIEFYRQAFDLKLKNRWKEMTFGSGDNETKVVLASAMLVDEAGGAIELFGDGVVSERQSFQQPIKHFAFAVTEIQSAPDKVLGAGAKLVQPPTQVAVGGMNATIAFVLGPDSERIELIQYKR